jgi:hypothetical protein
MVRSFGRDLSIAGTAVLALASAPAIAEPVKVAQGSATDLGVMSASLKDTVKLNYGIQGQLQGAGTPNEAGIGAFVPLKVNQNSVWFMDALANANYREGQCSSCHGVRKFGHGDQAAGLLSVHCPPTLQKYSSSVGRFGGALKAAKAKLP